MKNIFALTIATILFFCACGSDKPPMVPDPDNAASDASAATID